MRNRQSGFTLIEVVVALTLLGVTYAAILGAFSGSLKLLRQAAEYQNAVILARSKLDEIWVDPGMDIINRDAEEIYGGITYSYKIEVRPVNFVEEALKEKVKMPVKLEEILVEVYWGETGKEKTYALATYKMSPNDIIPPGQAGAPGQPGQTPGGAVQAGGGSPPLQSAGAILSAPTGLGGK